MEKFRSAVSAFIRDIYEEDKKVLVFGEGRVGAPVMMIGEAPGEQESLQGRPFVGKAGKNLDEFLSLARLNREEIFVTNTVKIRPTETGPTGRARNRAPNKEELSLFVPWLLREIAAVKPKALVTLGNVPLKALTDSKATVGARHGQWLDSRAGVPLFALYHPASILYRKALAPVYTQDVLTLAAALRGEEETDAGSNSQASPIPLPGKPSGKASLS